MKKLKFSLLWIVILLLSLAISCPGMGGKDPNSGGSSTNSINSGKILFDNIKLVDSNGNEAADGVYTKKISITSLSNYETTTITKDFDKELELAVGDYDIDIDFYINGDEISTDFSGEEITISKNQTFNFSKTVKESLLSIYHANVSIPSGVSTETWKYSLIKRDNGFSSGLKNTSQTLSYDYNPASISVNSNGVSADFYLNNVLMGKWLVILEAYDNDGNMVLSAEKELNLNSSSRFVTVETIATQEVPATKGYVTFLSTLESVGEKLSTIPSKKEKISAANDFYKLRITYGTNGTEAEVNKRYILEQGAIHPFWHKICIPYRKGIKGSFKTLRIKKFLEVDRYQLQANSYLIPWRINYES